MLSLKSIIFTLGCAATIVCSSCKDSETYAEHLQDEKDAINSFIKENKISVVNTRPDSTTEWLTEDGNPVYYKFSDGLYYHQIDKGDTTTLEPKVGSMVYVRYIGKTLSGEVYYDCTAAREPNPVAFRLLASPTYDDAYGEGFQKAVRCLYAGGHCEIIVPFKIANASAISIHGASKNPAGDYYPMYYEIWLTRVE